MISCSVSLRNESFTFSILESSFLTSGLGFGRPLAAGCAAAVPTNTAIKHQPAAAPCRTSRPWKDEPRPAMMIPLISRPAHPARLSTTVPPGRPAVPFAPRKKCPRTPASHRADLPHPPPLQVLYPVPGVGSIPALWPAARRRITGPGRLPEPGERAGGLPGESAQGLAPLPAASQRLATARST